MVDRSARSWMLAMLAALPLAFAGCGDDDDDGGSDGGASRDGGSITISQSTQPDFLDPALSYRLDGWEPMWLVYTAPARVSRARRARRARS